MDFIKADGPSRPMMTLKRYISFRTCAKVGHSGLTLTTKHRRSGGYQNAQSVMIGERVHDRSHTQVVYHQTRKRRGWAKNRMEDRTFPNHDF
jgi:hypothetical protein